MQEGINLDVCLMMVDATKIISGIQLTRLECKQRLVIPAPQRPPRSTSRLISATRSILVLLRHPCPDYIARGTYVMANKIWKTKEAVANA